MTAPPRPTRRTPLAIVAALILLTMIALTLRYGISPAIELLHWLDHWVDDHYTAAVLVHIVAFIVLATLSLPIGTLFCLSAGYLFGLIPGALAALMGATLAAILTFVLARSLGQDHLRQRWVASRFAPWLKELEQRSAWYLLLLRIVPVAPFFVVNAGAATTALTLRHYTIWTTLGLLPTCLIYAAIGHSLHSLRQLEQQLGPSLLLDPRVAIPLTALAVLIGLSRWLSQRHTQQAP